MKKRLCVTYLSAAIIGLFWGEDISGIAVADAKIMDVQNV